MENQIKYLNRGAACGQPKVRVHERVCVCVYVCLKTLYNCGKFIASTFYLNAFHADNASGVSKGQRNVGPRNVQ